MTNLVTLTAQRASDNGGDSADFSGGPLLMVERPSAAESHRAPRSGSRPGYDRHPTSWRRPRNQQLARFHPNLGGNIPGVLTRQRQDTTPKSIGRQTLCSLGLWSCNNKKGIQLVTFSFLKNRSSANYLNFGSRDNSCFSVARSY